MPTLQELAQQAQTQNVPGGGAPPPASMPTYAPRPQPPPDRSRTTTATSTGVAPGSVKSKADVEAAKRQKADEAAAAASQVGFGGGDPLDPHSAPTLEDFFSRFGPGFMDQTQAGQFNEAMGGSLQQPGMGEQQIQGTLGKFNTPSASEQQFAAAQAGGSGMDPYYDRARQETMASMDQALAARGAFGSSMGIGQIGSAMAQLGAQQANREADFMQQAAQQADAQKLGRLGLGGQLGLAGQRAGEQRFETGLQGAMGADAMAQAQFSTGANVAMATQAAKQGRIQDWLGNVMATSAAGADQVADAWQNMTGADREMFEQQMMMELGLSKEELNQLLSNQAQGRENFDQVMSAVGEAAEAGGNVATGIAGGGGGGYNPQEMRR